MIPQKNGTAIPSVAANLIEHLPAEDDPQRPMEEKLARQVAVGAYAGTLWCKLFLAQR